VGVSMLTVAGAAIGTSVKIAVKRRWTATALLYAMLVALPGKTKTPVISAVVGPLAAIDKRLRAFSREKRREWAKAKEQAKEQKEDVGPAPPLLQTVVKDITREALAVVLDNNARGVLCDRDEGAGWVKSFGEYKTGGADRQFWLSVWSSLELSVQRKGGQDIFVTDPFISVLAGLTPDMLDTMVDDRGRNDGFMDRILFAYPDNFPEQEWTEAEVSKDSEHAWYNTIGNLSSLTVDQKQTVTFDAQAKRLWVRWWNEHATEMKTVAETHTGAWSKMRTYAARFALILSQLRRATQPIPAPAEESILGAWTTPSIELPFGPVEAVDVDGAIKLTEYFKSHLLRVTRQMSGALGSADARQILAWIKRTSKTSFREADVSADLRGFRDDRAALAKALSQLEEVGVIRLGIETTDPSKPGPKPSRLYDVNPEVSGISSGEQEAK
jgi:hypothetical protein